MRLTTALIPTFMLACAIAVAAAPQGRGQDPATLTPEQQEARQARQAASAPDAPRPIDMLDTVWIEEMTWMETRDNIQAGKTTVIIGSGGLEQNGPYMPTGKHNFVLRTTCEATARKLGNAVCAPIVMLEPGNPVRENLTPGSVYITGDTFKAILTDMSTSLETMGFTDIVMIADSGGNVTPMREAVDTLNAQWEGSSARAYYIDEYYEQDKWSYDYLKTIGILQMPDVKSATRYDIHDDYHYESLVALANPEMLRAEQRKKAGKFSINRVEMESVERVLENGRKIADYRATITADAITKWIAEARSSQD